MGIIKLKNPTFCRKKVIDTHERVLYNMKSWYAYKM